MSEWLPSLNALRAFEAVARHLSYRDAAVELAVTPAAVKQLVAKLEDALGARLVVRQGRGLALTDAAQAGQGDLSLAIRHIEDAVRRMRAPADPTRVIVTVEASFATTWLVPRLEAFRSLHPGISVLIDSSQQIVDLARSDVDIAIRYGVAAKDGRPQQRLFDDLVFPACSPSLAAGPPALTSLDQLADAPLIHWDMSALPWANETRRWFNWSEWARLTGVEGIDPTKGLRFSDYGLAVQAATSGQGVVLASWPILRDPFDAGLLVRPFADSARSTGIGYDLLLSDAGELRPEAQAFADWVVDVARCEARPG